MGKKAVLLLLFAVGLSTLSVFVYQKVWAANVPPLKEGTYLVGQSLSVWPSWSVLGNALGSALPVDPINQLALAGTCAVTTNKFCVNNTQCPNGEACVLHDPSTGWSTADRRFSFACNRESYAYRYIVSSSTGAYTMRAHFEDPGITPVNFNNFVAGFVSTSIVKINEDSGVCNFDQEISTLQSGVCGDGRLNLDKGEQCDPPGRIQYQVGCVGNIKNLTVCNNACRWTASTTLCSNLSRCGNGTKESGETCDDGNLNGKYNHCNITCNGLSPLGQCGNGTVESVYEICDPHTPGAEQYSISGRENSCAWDCQNWGPYCGDKIVQYQYEQCDGSQSCSVDGHPGVKICSSSCKKEDRDAVAWWSFEDLVESSAGNHRFATDGTINNNNAECFGPFCPVLEQGKYGKSLNFSGTEANPKLLAVHNSPSLAITNAVSIEAWINPNSYEGLDQRIFEKGGPGSNAGYDLEFNGSATAHTASLNLWNGSKTSVDSSSAIPLNTWTHIVGTFERVGTNNISKIYVNGNLENTNASVGAVSSMAVPVVEATIGVANDLAGGYANSFLGKIDELKIYKRALSADEVRNNYQSNWFCLATSTPTAVTQPGACGNNIVDSNEACDRGAANNGRPCTPTYDHSCSYCSADCQNTIDVQPLQYCGNGIIENSEKCDMSDGVIYAAATSSNGTTATTKNVAHNGYQELACAEEPYVSHTLKKGTKTCGDCLAGVARSCVSCGVDTSGVGVNGGMINILATSTLPASTRDHLFAKDRGGSSLDLAIGNCYSVGIAIDDFLRENICNQTPLSSASPLVGRAIKDRNASDLTSYVLANPYGSGNALISSNPSCSSGDDPSKRYLMYINKDWTRPFNIVVVAAPQTWQYDFVLSPVIDNFFRTKDIRAVVSWVGPEDFFSGVLNPFIPNTSTVEINGASYCNPFASSCGALQKNYVTGIKYYTTPNTDFYGVWYHGFNSTPGQTNAESFTINTAAMTGNTYSFYVKSPSAPIRQFKNTARLKVEIYLPETNYDPYVETAGQEDLHNPYRFGTPVKTIYLQASAPSDNPNAKYWEVFNINKPTGSNPVTLDDIIEINTIRTGPANFSYYIAGNQ
jgi:hypothetical protein